MGSSSTIYNAAGDIVAIAVKENGVLPMTRTIPNNCKTKGKR